MRQKNVDINVPQLCIAYKENNDLDDGIDQKLSLILQHSWSSAGA